MTSLETGKNVTSTQVELDKLLTSHEVGSLLQVNPSSVNKWVNDGLIPAFRTPGKHRRIRLADLLSFLDTHKMPVPEELRAPKRRRRLLVVDDDPKQLTSMKRVLKRHADEVEVQVVDNGIDALVLVGSFKPHVVLLDVFMPGVDGIEVCRRLNANPLTSAIDVIVTSAQLTADVAKRAKAAGATRCLHKPIDVSLVLQDLAIPIRHP